MARAMWLGCGDITGHRAVSVLRRSEELVGMIRENKQPFPQILCLVSVVRQAGRPAGVGADGGLGPGW